MPVVTSRRASIETQNAVPRRAVFSCTIGGICSASRRSAVIGRQIEPAPVRGHEIHDLGVTNSAAQARSPSFSRSSSSTITTTRPARRSASTSSTVANRGSSLLRAHRPPRAHQGVKIPRDEIHLHVEPVARPRRPSRVRATVSGSRPPRSSRGQHRGDRQGDAVKRDRALLRDEAAQAAGGSATVEPHVVAAAPQGDHPATASTCPWNEVTAQPVPQRQRALEMHEVSAPQRAKRRARRASRRPRRPRTRPLRAGRRSGRRRRPRRSRRLPSTRAADRSRWSIASRPARERRFRTRARPSRSTR